MVMYDLTNPAEINFGEPNTLEYTFTQPGYYSLWGHVNLKAVPLNSIRVYLVNLQSDYKLSIRAHQISSREGLIEIEWNTILTVTGEETWRLSVTSNGKEIDLHCDMSRYLRMS